MPGWADETLVEHRGHASACHARWAQRRLTDRYRQEWIPDQCGGCIFFIELSGALGSDWGACTNPASPHDGTLMFEHDGCPAHRGEPLSPEELAALDAARAERLRQMSERARPKLEELRTRWQSRQANAPPEEE
jgi:hypothetical protein